MKMKGCTVVHIPTQSRIKYSVKKIVQKTLNEHIILLRRFEEKYQIFIIRTKNMQIFHVCSEKTSVNWYEK